MRGCQVLFTWYPYFLKVRFLTSSSSSLFGSVPWIVMATGAILFGFIMDRLKKDSLLSVLSYAVVTASLVTISFLNDLKAFLILMIFTLFFLNPILLSSWRLSTRLSGEMRPSFVGGWMNFWGNAGGIVAPFISALMLEREGFSRTFLLSSLIPIAGLLCWLSLRRWEK